MFDRYEIKPPAGTTHVNVTHGPRAPTDDSIRLAKEYEEKAWKAVESSVLRDVPGFEVKFVTIERRCDRWSTVIMFKVNEKPFTIEFDQHAQAGMENFVRAMAEKISVEIVSHMLRAVPLQTIARAR